MTSTDQHCYEI